ncbi:MAG: hypothetical protein KDB80_15500, partial [Planctomycetes bacterium]|nr:hypothetical protein [Planctomycetota bacterium]
MEEFFIFVGFVFSLVCGLVVANLWAKHRQDRLRVLDEALRNGDVDPETKRAILDSLQAKFPLRKVVFSVGWIAIFLGIGLLASNDRDAFFAGTIIAPLGFGIVTL